MTVVVTWVLIAVVAALPALAIREALTPQRRGHTVTTLRRRQLDAIEDVR